MSAHSLRIVKALSARLTTIRKTAGYASDAGAQVYLGREDLFTDDITLPCLSILEGVTTAEGNQTQNQLYKATTPFAIVGLTASEPDQPLVAGHALRADVLAALFKTRARGTRLDLLEGTASSFVFDSSEVLPRDDGGHTTAVIVNCRVTYTLNAAQPEL